MCGVVAYLLIYSHIHSRHTRAPRPPPHYATTDLREGIIQGQQDYDLTPIGVNQAVATAVRLRKNTYWQTHSSDLKRASRTAQIILEEHADAIIKKNPLLREFALGVQEDLPRGTSWWVCCVSDSHAGVCMKQHAFPSIYL